jgi:hypothetical protein
MEREDINRAQSRSNEIKSNKTSKGMYRYEKNANETKEAKLPQKKSTEINSKGASRNPKKGKEPRRNQKRSREIIRTEPSKANSMNEKKIRT